MEGTVGTGASPTAPEGGSAPTRRAPLSDFVGARLGKRFLTTREGSITVVTVLLVIYFSSTTPAFFTGSNFTSLLPYFAPVAILAAGEVFLMINGEIDLSVGGVYLFAPFLYYEIYNGGLGLIPSLIITLLACMVIGFANGIFVALIGVNSFIATLGTLFTLEGLTLIISHAAEVPMPGAQTNAAGGVGTFAKIFGAGTYSELIWALAIIFVMQVILTRTRWGLYTIAVGSNRLAASEAGVKVRANIIRNFVVCSLFAGLVGILEDVRTTSIEPDPSGATTILLYAIAAAVIGGTLLVGGSGTVIGALIGALFLGVLEDGLNIKGVNANYLFFYLGAAILLAMVINVYVGRVRRRSGVG